MGKFESSRCTEEKAIRVSSVEPSSTATMMSETPAEVNEALITVFRVSAPYLPTLLPGTITPIVLSKMAYRLFQ